jgi:hypothetical protein
VEGKQGSSPERQGALPPIVLECLAEREKKVVTPSEAVAPSNLSHEEDGDKATVEYAIPVRIRTLEDAIAYAEVDTKVWRVAKWSCTSWETGMKLRTFHDNGKVARETPHRTHQWRIKLELERILPKPLHDATDAIFEAMKAYAPKYPALAKRATPTKPHLCVVDLFDVHFGKLAWAPETGENYDLKIAEQLYRNAVIDLLNEAAAYEIDRFLLPFGNDFLHIDGAKNETTAGTPQDVDGRFAKIYEAGEAAVIWAIEYLAAVAPVDVILVPGNHDRNVSYCLSRTIKAWFHNCEQVSVDTRPIPRKKFVYGKTLLGFTHGNEEKHGSLPTIMATEWPNEWAATTCREFHLGHVHQSKKMVTTPVNTQDGVAIRTLMSLSGSDAWHHRKGYVGSMKAAEALVYRKDSGFVANFVAKARLGK